MNSKNQTKNLTEQQLKITNDVIGDLIKDRPFMLLIADEYGNLANVTGNCDNIDFNLNLIESVKAQLIQAKTLNYFD